MKRNKKGEIVLESMAEWANFKKMNFNDENMKKVAKKQASGKNFKIQFENKQAASTGLKAVVQRVLSNKLQQSIILFFIEAAERGIQRQVSLAYLCKNMKMKAQDILDQERKAMDTIKFRASLEKGTPLGDFLN